MLKRSIVSLVGGILLLGGSVLIAPAVQAGATSPAGTTVIYDSTTSPQPGNIVSEAFEATQTSEFGNEVTFAPGSSTSLNSTTVQLSSWGCQTGSWTGGCVTTPGATFSEPITFNIYNVGPGNTVGSLITSVTQTFNIPYRPSASPTQCPAYPTTWYDAADGQCYNGLLTSVTFHFTGVTLPSSVIYGVAYNTSDYGYSPYGDATACHATSAGCGYDSLNIGLTTANGPSVGTDPLPGYVFQNTGFGPFYCDGGAAGTGTFRLDSPSTPPCWGSDPTNVGDYSTPPWYIPAVQFVANQLSQTIHFVENPTTPTVGQTFTLNATATSGLPVVYSVAYSGACTVSGNVLTITAAGICNVVAFQNGNALYSAAAPVLQTIYTYNSQSLSFTSSPPSVPYVGGPTYAITAKATSGLPVTYGSASAGVCSVSGNTVSFQGSGTCNIVAFQNGNSSYASATPIVQGFTVFPQVAPSFAGSPTSVSATLLQSFSKTFSVFGIPTPTSVKVISGLPLGVSASGGSNGQITISGTPFVFGSYQVTLQATNSAGTTNFTFTLNIAI